ncbi:HTH-type transcriptional regulator GbpR [compost metagenome]|jgi:DNA-binding transcriptional LysR family regulator|uniref:LysR family transcriptional regulator n=1 Tax=Pseudomonas putida TRO1 TaxID=1227924 RepID=A0AAD2WEM9_PSEPU|nr:MULTISPECIES: LysR family transcriptional regulator [Pseudomonas]ANI31975.1 LysR family transcriptional regulator [Pseudomonas sp. JY-Q]EKT4502978.1 LysR family transcriptional regulator [Pseudomonas putida]EKT4540632.1 LysR family transcriptional regulator [Pseudomonas putida]EKT4564522.1 LysR family transcriptional regulator [Pseudomonas putida]ELS0921816.1 LysR family transcriptional regulator [Pseudomonas putida]
MLTLKQLKHLMAIHQHGSIHRAAEALYITQPALTRSLGNLEEAFGVRLFDRSKSGMQATDFYLKIRDRCAHLLLEVEELEREAGLYRNLESGKLSIGMGRASRELILCTVLPKFVKQHPHIQVQIREGVSEELAYGLTNCSYDLVIAGVGSYRHFEGLIWQELQRLRISLVVRSGHPLTQQQGIPLTELMNFPLVSATELSPSHPVYKRHPALAELNISVLCSDFHVLKQITLETDAVMVAPERQFQAELDEGSLVILDIAGLELMIELCAIELAGRSRSPAAQRFIELCQELLPTLA